MTVFRSKRGNRRADAHFGFTLLEVLIALALSVVIVGAIAMAVRLHLINLDKQARKIEYKQVARSVLTMIASDLRNGVAYKPIDYAVLDELLASQAAQLGQMMGAGGGAEPGGDTGGGTTTGGAGGASSGGGGATGGDASGQSSSSSEEAASEPLALPEEEVQGRPTLVGSTRVVSIDVSRIPRIDEYNLLTTGNAAVQTPSDIKTVVYFLEEANNETTQPKFKILGNAAPGGLYRRQIDRSVASYRGEEGIVNVLDEYAELVAPEIAQISFRYFDGEDWLDEWDSVETGGFPPAIEINLVVDPSRLEGGSGYRYGGFDPDSMERYRMVVGLPTAQPAGGGAE